MLSSEQMDRLATIQFHYKRTGSRFIAALACKLAMTHPCFVPDLAYVQKHWVQEISSRITDYRVAHKLRVEHYLKVLDEEREGLITPEEAEAVQQEVHDNMDSWKGDYR
jgi:hypothetical protein